MSLCIAEVWGDSHLKAHIKMSDLNQVAFVEQGGAFDGFVVDEGGLCCDHIDQQVPTGGCDEAGLFLTDIFVVELDLCVLSDDGFAEDGEDGSFGGCRAGRGLFDDQMGVWDAKDFLHEFGEQVALCGVEIDHRRVGFAQHAVGIGDVAFGGFSDSAVVVCVRSSCKDRDGIDDMIMPSSGFAIGLCEAVEIFDAFDKGF